MLSAIVLTKNEAGNITACLKSLRWCDEIIVIDDCSQDETVVLAQKLGAKVYRRALQNDFAGQRNFGLAKASGAWVLFVDADERVTPPLRDEIIQAINLPVAGYFLKRVDYLWGRPLQHGETAHVRLLRLARKTAGQWQRQVHEIWQIKGATEELKNPLFHYPHQDLSEFIDHLNFHSSLHAQALAKEHKKSSIVKVAFYPPAKFLQNYFWRQGFLDGMPGLISALMMSWHSFFNHAKQYVKNH